MPTLTVNGHTYHCLADETVLDTLLREQVAIAYSCKKGSCQSCLVQSQNAPPPEQAQTGLKNTLKHQHYFLACQCYPEQDMALKLPDPAAFYTVGTVVTAAALNKNTRQLVLSLDAAFNFKPGQYVNLQRPDGLTRSYSIANTPQPSPLLEFHIRRLDNGRFSTWLHDEIKVGDTLAVSEAHGHCFYLPERTGQGLLLVGTGTGLAPLAGILADALAQGHDGPIYLFHGSRTADDLYYIETLRQLSQQHPNFHYFPCLSGQPIPEGFSAGRAHDVALATLPELKGWRVYLCGHPDMVAQMRRMAFLKGASMQDIYTDAFVLSAR